MTSDIEIFDYIIVGGGSGGCTVASRLSEDPKASVCLLEAGGDGTSVMIRMPSAVAAILPRPILNWALETEPQPGLNGRKGYQPRGKELYTENIHSDQDIRDIIRQRADTVYHPVGSCKMGNDDMAVVDDQLRVHGVKNLRIADASIMPTLIGGNTNAPTIMIGEKCAEMIQLK